MLTAPLGQDVTPYHNREIVVPPRTECLRWLDPTVPAREVVTHCRRGTLI